MNEIRVLIVEDDKAKLERVYRAVTRNSSNRIIVTAESASEARSHLQKAAFDLLILDVALPQFNGERPVAELGLSLLRDVTESSLYHRPRYILGITAHEDLVENAQKEFHGRLWRMLFSAPSDDHWVSLIATFADHIAKAAMDASERRHMTDVCVITALRTPELDAVLHLPWHWQAALPLDETTFYYKGKVHRPTGSSVEVVAASALRMGMVPATLLASKLVEKLRPRILIMCGICAGLKGKVELGDIVVATETWAWESGKLAVLKGAATFQPDIRTFSTDESLLARFDLLRADREWLSAIQSEWQGRKLKTSLQMRTGSIATGSPVVADTSVVERIVSTNRKTIAIEMEGYGVHSAAVAFGRPEPLVAIVKSVCDFADSKKHDGWHGYAAYTSARTVQALVERYGEDIIGSRPG